MFGDYGYAEIGAGVKPGLRPCGRNRGRWILVCRLREVAGTGEGGEFSGIPLIDSAEAAELALYSVKVAVVVGVARDETVAAYVVVALDALNHVHREGKAGEPGRAGQFVGDVELGGGRVLNDGLSTEVVGDANE